MGWLPSLHDSDNPCQVSDGDLPVAVKIGIGAAEGGAAEGGAAYDETTGTTRYAGGAGGFSTGIIYLNTTDTLYIYVGQKGYELHDTTITSYPGYCLSRTFNGGGYACQDRYHTYNAAGGGGTDIRINSNSLYARVIVAGGGGGNNNYNIAGSNTNTGYGGGNIGQNGNVRYAYSTAASGGTQITGGGGGTHQASVWGTSEDGSFGYGGNGTVSKNSKGSTSGGGGGWYGGASSNGGTNYCGGGGSGYLNTSKLISGTSQTIIAGDSSGREGSAAVDVADIPNPTSDDGTLIVGNTSSGYARITVMPYNN